jgi:beta-galactosidase
MPAVTENLYGQGKAYYVAFRNDEDFSQDFCEEIIGKIGIEADTCISAQAGVVIRKRGDVVFLMNFTDEDKKATLDVTYTDLLTSESVFGEIMVPSCGYVVLK